MDAPTPTLESTQDAPAVFCSEPENHPMKTPDQIKPNCGPVYAAAMYPDLAAIFQRHGYALAVHGSLARDFDLIAVAWADKVSSPTAVLDAVMEQFAVTLSPDSPNVRNHGRAAYTLICGFGECRMDLSFLPRFNDDSAEEQNESSAATRHEN